MTQFIQKKRLSAMAIAAICFTILSCEGENEMNRTYHPFRSHDAKELYLKYYDSKAKAWPVQSETKSVTTSFGDTFIRISGSPDDPPLVLLPGDTESSLSWIPQIEDFSKRFRIIAIDNIYNNGRSVYSRPMKKPQDYVSWLDELFDELELEENINLIGFSYGGWQSCLYAMSRPERLRKLVLISAPVVPPRLVYLIRAITTHFIPSLLRSQVKWERKCLIDKGERGQKILNDLIEDALLGQKCFKPRSFVSPTLFSDQEWSALKMPVLYLVGGEEVMYSPEKAVERIYRLNAAVKTVIIPDACHCITHSQAETVNKHILEFL